MTAAATDLWNVLHDGTIARIDGEVPGDIRLKVEIQYLRNMFSPPGESIDVTLIKCKRMEFRASNESARRAISQGEVTILSAKRDDAAIVVDSSAGDIVLEYDSFALELDSGETISLERLAQASRQYWDNLARQHSWAWPGCVLVLIVLAIVLVWLIKTLFW